MLHFMKLIVGLNAVIMLDETILSVVCATHQGMIFTAQCSLLESLSSL